MSTLAYVTDARGRAGTYQQASQRKPKTSLPAALFRADERSDGLHIVEVATGRSYGIAATPAIAAAQIGAFQRLAR